MELYIQENIQTSFHIVLTIQKKTAKPKTTKKKKEVVEEAPVEEVVEDNNQPVAENVSNQDKVYPV